MNILPAQSSDLPDIEKVFFNCFINDARTYPVQRATNLFVAKDNGKIVGAGGLFINSLHAKVPKAAIAVESEYRRKGLGGKIHLAILESQPDIPLGIDGCCFDNNSSVISFLTQLDYRPYLDCFIPIIDTLTEFPTFDEPKNLTLLSFNQAASNGIDMNAILQFLVNKYCDSHAWSPVTIPKDSPDWKEIAFWGTDKDISMVGLVDGLIVGASTASVDGEVLQIQWPFASASNIAGETALLMSLLGRQFKIAKQRGLSKATFECDSTEEAMFHIPKKLKVLKSKTWRRFRFTP